jgi:hypothetical protein
MKRAREEFNDFAHYATPNRREDLENATLVAMATADDRGYAALPESVRTLINRDPMNSRISDVLPVSGNDRL